MSVGKYSPTVSRAYSEDRQWWEKNGGGFGNGTNPESDDDNDGYDSYGYSDNGNGVDRAGHTEFDYLLSGKHIDDDYVYVLYERVHREWQNK